MTDGNAADFELVKMSPLFEGLGEMEIHRLIALGSIRKYPPGEAVVEQGSPGDAIFILYDGSLSVSTTRDSGDDIILTTLDKRGAFIGEVSVVDQGPRSATVTVKDTATMMELTIMGIQQFFSEFSDAEPIVLRNIAKVLARRLRDSNILLGSH